MRCALVYQNSMSPLFIVQDKLGWFPESRFARSPFQVLSLVEKYYLSVS